MTLNVLSSQHPLSNAKTLSRASFLRLSYKHLKLRVISIMETLTQMVLAFLARTW